MTFFRENSYTVVRLGLNQFGMAMFGLVVSFATSANKTLLVLGGILAMLMYWFLLYSVCWTEGGQHRIRVDGGREKKSLLNGVKLGLAANAVNLVLSIVYAVCYSIGPLYEWAANVALVLNAVLRIFFGMYLGIISAAGIRFSCVFLVISLIGILVCEASYLLGYRQTKFLFSAKKRAD